VGSDGRIQLDSELKGKLTGTQILATTNQLSQNNLETTMEKLEELAEQYPGFFEIPSIGNDQNSVSDLQNLLRDSIRDYDSVGTEQEVHIKGGNAKAFLDDIYGTSNSTELRPSQRIIYQALRSDSKEFQKNHPGSLSRGYIHILSETNIEGNYSVESTYYASNLLIIKITGDDKDSIKARKLIYQKMLGYSSDDLDDNGYIKGFNLTKSLKPIPTIKHFIDQQTVISNARTNILTESRTRILESVMRFARHTLDPQRVDFTKVEYTFNRIFENSEQFFASTDPEERSKLIQENMELAGLNPDDINLLSTSTSDLFLNPSYYTPDSSLKEMFKEILDIIMNLINNRRS
jgi:hypothetical protein